jgi:hypothetical protein
MSGFGAPARNAGRFKSFSDEIKKHRVQREPAQHVLGPSHPGSYAQQAQPRRQGPDVSGEGSGTTA